MVHRVFHISKARNFHQNLSKSFCIRVYSLQRQTTQSKKNTRVDRLKKDSLPTIENLGKIYGFLHFYSGKFFPAPEDITPENFILSLPILITE